MFATFSIFWSTLIFFVSSPAYYWGPKEVGILAILVYRGIRSTHHWSSIRLLSRAEDCFDWPVDAVR